MKLSELIDQLKDLYERHGDLPVVVESNGYDSEDQECEGARFQGTTQHKYPKPHAEPAHIRIESDMNKFWDYRNQPWGGK